MHVQLFGALASVTTERTLDLVVPKPTTVGTVVAALAERLGEVFLARVLDKAGTKQRYCRLFVAGVQIEDLRTPDRCRFDRNRDDFACRDRGWLTDFSKGIHMNMMNVVNKAAPAADDVWIPSSCSLCYGTCSILAHRVDGVVVKIEGNPESALGKGRLCGKGVSGIMTHYDPNRLTRPLRRTNPKKGLNEDPKWKEISWDEALDEISAVLKKVRAEDPRKLVVQRTTTVTASRVPFQTFAAAFGTPNFSVSGGGQHCGNGAHLISGMMHASWSIVPDFEYCNYAIYFGASKGHSAGHASCSNMGKAADARARGMKMVVVDPICNFAAAKATEWVPLRVGTDAALALAMCNVMVNELGIYDGPYLQAKTNAPYLIGPDKLYVRHPESKQPLVWDSKNNVARRYTDVAAADMALEGEFTVNGTPCRPSFHCLRDHLRKFTPEWAEEISTIGAATIRRLAKEFAHRSPRRQHHRGRWCDAALSTGRGDRLPRVARSHELGLQFLCHRSSQSSCRCGGRGRLMPRFQSGLPRPS